MRRLGVRSIRTDRDVFLRNNGSDSEGGEAEDGAERDHLEIVGSDCLVRLAMND